MIVCITDGSNLEPSVMSIPIYIRTLARVCRARHSQTIKFLNSSRSLLPRARRHRPRRRLLEPGATPPPIPSTPPPPPARRASPRARRASSYSPPSPPPPPLPRARRASPSTPPCCSGTAPCSSFSSTPKGNQCRVTDRPPRPFP